MDICPKKTHADGDWQATLVDILSNFREELEAASNANAMCHQPVPKKLTPEALFMLCTILLFIILTVIGSSFGLYENLKASGKKKCSPKVERKSRATARTADKKSSDTYTVCVKYFKIFIDCFCIRKNARRVLNTATTQPKLRCLHGIRGLTMIITLISHTGIFYATALKSLDEFQHILNLPILQFKYNGIIGIDVFIILSGFLLGYSFSEMYEKRNGRIPWISFYVYRYLKISPLYFIVLGFYSTLLPHLGSGPVWPTYDTNPVCKENWMRNVLYINNFNSHKNLCLATSWYLPLDMQLYVISPLFLLPLLKRPILGFIMIILAICGSCLAFIGLTLKYNLLDGMTRLPQYIFNLKEFYSRFWLYFDTVYVTPYTRMGSFLCGLLLGYYLYRNRSSSIKNNSLVTLTLGWTVSIILTWIAYSALYGRTECLWETALYNGFKHIMFSCSVSWIIFVCVTGQGGLYGRLLSNKLLLPLSRISYTVYLIHLVILEGYFLSITELIEFSVTSMVLHISAIVLVILAASFVVSLLFETPLIRIVSLFFKRTAKETDQKSKK